MLWNGSAAYRLLACCTTLWSCGACVLGTVAYLLASQLVDGPVKSYTFTGNNPTKKPDPARVVKVPRLGPPLSPAHGVGPQVWALPGFLHWHSKGLQTGRSNQSLRGHLRPGHQRLAGQPASACRSDLAGRSDKDLGSHLRPGHRRRAGRDGGLAEGEDPWWRTRAASAPVRNQPP